MAGKKKGNTVETVWALAEPIARELGLILWDVRFLKEGANWYLRIFIDKPGGVGIDDCVAMSHAIDGPLDDLDPIDQSYSLQVSSPGLNRELSRDEHFRAYLGEPVAVRLIRPLEDGRRELSGVLEAYASGPEGSLSLRLDSGELLTLPRGTVSRVRAQDDDF